MIENTDTVIYCGAIRDIDRVRYTLLRTSIVQYSTEYVQYIHVQPEFEIDVQ